jgi:broad specificity polyphosphatase/5'/3'-nucleotidase SurE
MEGGDGAMTVATQVQTTLAGLKSAQASLESFAIQTQNKEAKSMFEQAAQTTQQVIDQLDTRYEQIQNEEPQY